MSNALFTTASQTQAFRTRTRPLNATDIIEKLTECRIALDSESQVKVVNGIIGSPALEMLPRVHKDWTVKLDAQTKFPYVPYRGITQCRQDLQKVIEKDYNLNYSGQPLAWDKNILFTAGAGGATATLMRCLPEHSHIILPTPNYLYFAPQITGNGNVVCPIKCDKEYKFSAIALEEEIEAAKRQCGHHDHGGVFVLLSYPNNPTGSVLTLDEWKPIAKVLQKHKDVGVILDETYRYVSFDPTPAPSLLQAAPDLAPRTALIFSGSKGPGIADHRIGAVIADESLIKSMTKQQIEDCLAAPGPAQFAFVESLKELANNSEARDKLASYYRDNIFAMQEALKGCNTSKHAVIDLDYSPKGGFFLMGDFSEMINKPMNARAKDAVASLNGKPHDGFIHTDVDIAFHLLFQHKVLLLPGSCSLLDANAGKMRVSCTERENLRAIAERIGQAIQQTREVDTNPSDIAAFAKLRTEQCAQR